MATTRGDPTAVSTSTVIDALNGDEESSGASESEYENASDANSSRMEDTTEQGMDQGIESEQGSELASSSSSSVPSLLSVLRAPRLSDLTRKRKTQTNYGKRKKTCSSSSASSDPKGVQPQDRVKKFPDEQLSVSAGKLFCKACREELSLKSSSLSNHLKSQKHKDGKRRLQKKEATEQDIAKKLVSYNKETHAVGETLTENTQVFRVKVVSTFLRAGIPLNKLDIFRELFEENGYRLTDKRNMFDLIPFIQKHETDVISEEIKGKDVSVVFDGTTRLGEALAIVLRYVDDGWNINQRLVRLQVVVKSLTGEELARELISVLSVQYSIGTQQLLAAMKDRASVNETALRTLKIIYPSLLSVGCFSHTIDRVGEHFSTPNLSEFITSWVSLFSHSPKTRILWRDQTGKAMATYSATRWWSRWEVIEQVSVQFGDVFPFLRRDDLGSTATTAKLITHFTDPQRKALLEVELAAIIDWGRPFVKATYSLEGDGPLALDCYEKIETVKAAINTAHTPNLEAVARRLSSSADKCLLQRVFPTSRSRGSTSASQSLQQRIVHYGYTCVQPGLDYFEKHFNSNLDTLMAFKAARLFSPPKLNDLQPNADAVNGLKHFPFLNSKPILDGLKEELPSYLAKVVDIDTNIDVLQWWKQNESVLPCWAAAARKSLLVQPSSAASERVFSLLKSSFNPQQQSSLVDYIEASLMLQYNARCTS